MGRSEDAISVLTIAAGDVEEEGEEFGERGRCQRDEVDGFCATYLVDRDGLTVRNVLSRGHGWTDGAFVGVTGGQRYD
jgi:hypothetical protein